MRPFLKMRTEGGVSILVLVAQKLDEADPADLWHEFCQLGDDRVSSKVVISFADVRYLTSLDLGVLIEFLRQMKVQGGELVLADMDDNVFGVFEVTRLNRLFEIRRTSEDAIKSLTPA